MLANILTAVNAIKAFGIGANVVAPNNSIVAVTVHVSPQAPFSSASVISAVQTAITSYINTLGVGVNVSYVNLANVIGSTQIGGINCVFAYTGLLLNSTVGDFLISTTQLARAGAITVLSP
jgi:hypothetical protein